MTVRGSTKRGSAKTFETLLAEHLPSVHNEQPRYALFNQSNFTNQKMFNERECNKWIE